MIWPSKFGISNATCSMCYKQGIFFFQNYEYYSNIMFERERKRDEQYERTNLVTSQDNRIIRRLSNFETISWVKRKIVTGKIASFLQNNNQRSRWESFHCWFAFRTHRTIILSWGYKWQCFQRIHQCLKSTYVHSYTSSFCNASCSQIHIICYASLHGRRIIGIQMWAIENG